MFSREQEKLQEKEIKPADLGQSDEVWRKEGGGAGERGGLGSEKPIGEEEEERGRV